MPCTMSCTYAAVQICDIIRTYQFCLWHFLCVHTVCVTLFIKLATLLTMTALYLTKGREKPLLRRHTWVLS